jgi:uncharacterized membrane protein
MSFPTQPPSGEEPTPESGPPQAPPPPAVPPQAPPPASTTPPAAPPPQVPPTAPPAAPGYAPPPAPPAPAYTGAAATTGGSQVDVGSAFTWAFQKFGQHAAVLVGLAAVVFVIRLLEFLVSRAVFNSLNNCDNPNVIVGQNGSITIQNCTVALGTSILVNVLIGIVFGILAFLATVGIYRAALKTTLGDTPSFQHLTSGENLGPFIVVAIVFGLASFAGLALCILPGLVVIFLFQFAPFYALDKGQGVGQAFGNSFRAVTANFLPVLLAAIINIVATWLGGLLFGLLTLVLLPFAALFTANIYRQVNHEAVAP